MSKNDDAIREDAIDWVIRLRGGSPGDWEAFTGWLERDPRHAAVYEDVALLDDELGSLPRQRVVPAIISQAPARRVPSRRHVLGIGLAAALTLTLGLGVLQQQPDLYSVETGPGERRVIALEDGSRIDLNGGSRVVLHRDNVRFAELERGEALFTVVHDEQRPFEVTAGSNRLLDLGTVFNVVQDGTTTEVQVAEGRVLFNPDEEAVDLRPGMQLQDDGARVKVSRIDAAVVDSWRSGRLVYSDAPVAQVVRDLARNTGLRVSADPQVGAGRFTGVIVLDGNRELLFQRTAALLGVRAVRAKGGWLLTRSPGATP